VSTIPTDVWYAFVPDAWVLQEGPMRALLSPDECVRLDQRPRERGRTEFLVAHVLVRVALSRHTDVAPDRWVLEADAGGRPEIAGPTPAGSLHFSLSHTRGLVACAISSSGAIGIDAESIGRRLSVERLARRVLCGSERGALGALPEAERRVRLLEYWTLKEAHTKALGTGLRSPLRDTEFALAADGRARLVGSGGREWRHLSWRPGPDHVLAVACSGQTLPVLRHHEWHPAADRVVVAHGLD
jgi:4'-phosphopantetheinyl transferase